MRVKGYGNVSPLETRMWFIKCKREKNMITILSFLELSHESIKNSDLTFITSWLCRKRLQEDGVQLVTKIKLLASCSAQLSFLSWARYPVLPVRNYVLCAFSLNITHTCIIYMTLKCT